MSGFARRELPADIAVFAGRFGGGSHAQPIVFAHLIDIAPTLDLDHVEVIPTAHAARRMSPYFDASAVAALEAKLDGDEDTLILILPSSFDGLSCPVGTSAHMRDLGMWRGRVPRMVATGDVS
jgi:hypothetical protein